MAEVREREETVALRRLLPPHLIRVVLECARLLLEVMLVCKQFHRLQWRYYDHKVRLSWAYLCAVGKRRYCPALPTNINWATITAYQSHDRKRTPLGIVSSLSEGVLVKAVEEVQCAVHQMFHSHYHNAAMAALCCEDVHMMVHFGNLGCLDGIDCTWILRFAAQNGFAEGVEYLLTQDVNINAVGAIGRSPLYSAVVGKHLRIIQCLLEHDANVNTGTHNNWTALHCAVYGGNLSIIQCLLKHGANTSCVSNWNTTPLDSVRHDVRNRDVIISLLTQTLN